MTDDKTAVIYVVATPLGNLGDLSERARKTLASVDIIAAEDTRHTRKLLTHFGIEGKQLISYHDHNEQGKADSILERLINRNESLALVSDAGTPCISDPGYRLIDKAWELGIKIHPIPGPSSVTTLMSASGLPSDRFLFVGFLPQKLNAQKNEVASWIDMRASIIFFESPRRISKTLQVIAEQYPESRVAIGRELTKLYEEISRMSVHEALVWASSHDQLKGELTVVLDVSSDARHHGEFKKVDLAQLTEEAHKAFKKGSSLKDLLQKYKDCGLSRSALYQLLLDAKKLNSEKAIK